MVDGRLQDYFKKEKILICLGCGKSVVTDDSTLSVFVCNPSCKGVKKYHKILS